MKNFAQEKHSIPMTAPAGGVVSGGGYLIGSIFCVAKVDAPAGATFAAVVNAGVSLPKANLAIAEGATVFWDATALNVTTVSTGGNAKIGFAGQYGAQAGDATVVVFLNGTA